MKITAALLLLAATTPSLAADIDATKCIADAAARVPASNLVKLMAATTRAMTDAEAKQYPTGPALWVDVIADVAGKATTYRFVCAITHAGRVVRERD